MSVNKRFFVCFFLRLAHLLLAAGVCGAAFAPDDNGACPFHIRGYGGPHDPWMLFTQLSIAQRYLENANNLRCFAHPTVTAKKRALPLERTVAYDVAEQRWLGACCVTRPRTVDIDEQVFH